MKNSDHGFNVEIAKDIGVHGALIYRTIEFWTDYNKKHKKNFIEGRYWTYIKLSALVETYEYLTEHQIRTAIKKLKENEYIMVQQGLGDNKYDRSNYYAVVEEKVEPKPVIAIQNNLNIERKREYIGNNGNDKIYLKSNGDYEDEAGLWISSSIANRVKDMMKVKKF